MEMKRGTVVQSLAGRDRDRLMVVLACREGRVLVADGKVRKLACPKAKNPRHLRQLGCCLSLEDCGSDKALRKALTMLDL